MARPTKPLSCTEIDRAKPKEKDYKLQDGQGLFLLVKSSGSKLWRFRYNKPITGKQTELGLGSFPDLSLAQARVLRAEYRALLAQDVDPLTFRQEESEKQAQAIDLTFLNMAKQWLADRKNKANFSERTANDVWAMLERHALPKIGAYPLSQLTPLLVINYLKPLEQAGKLTTLHKTITKINEVMRYALHRGLIPYNPLAEIAKEFDRPAESQGMATIQPEELSGFMKQLYQARDARRFQLPSFYAVLLVLLTGARPSEAAQAKWEDIDLTKKIWAYRVQKGNKNLPEGRLHRVTLSRQAVAILRKVKAYNAMLYHQPSPFVFPNPSAKRGHLTIEAIRQAIIKSVGGVGILTTHGIRALLSTSLNEQNYNDDWIEKALSHKDKNRIRRAYNKAEYLEQRATMLQAWGDYVESLAPEKITD